MRKNWFVVFEITNYCKPSLLCDIPLVKGDCVGIPLVRGDSGGCFGIPLSEEVIVVVCLCAYPLVVRLILCGLVPCL